MSTDRPRIGARMKQVLGGALAGPQMLAFLPALCLGAFWFGGEGALIVAAITVPAALAVSGVFGEEAADHEGTDEVTGLALLPKAEAALNRTLSRMGRFGFSTACFAIKVDDFKGMTERLGSTASEDILRQIGGRITTACRTNDVVARHHGASFIVALSAIRRADLEDMIQLAGRIQDAISEPVALDGLSVHVTASIGFALPSRAPQTGARGLIAAAECAMIDADRNGPGAIRAYSEDMKTRLSEKSNLMAEAARALEDGQIVPWFQPQISTDTGEVTGFEALARWIHPQQGIIPPGHFLSALEDAGLYPRLGQVMLYHGLRAIRDWDKTGVKVPCVGVNFSSDELKDPALVDRIRWELDRFELTPDRLCVEILETVVAGNADDITTRNISALAELGCKIDLDDFGTGHASIANIRRLEINRLKIDRSFITRMDKDPEQQRLVSAILTMAERLDLETLAEGVETQGEHALLSQLGCDHVQGFGIAKPMPFDDTLAWMDRQTRKVAGAKVVPRQAS